MKFVTTALLLACLQSAFAEDMLRFLRDDRMALQARVDILQQAKKEILIEYYSVWNDDQSLGGIALLIDAAKKGIKVKVILDAISTTLPEKTIAALLERSKDANGVQNLEIKFYNQLRSITGFTYFTNRDHAKMIIVDGDILITGGRNVGDKYFGVNSKRNYTDLDILSKGNIAKSARENFYEAWNSPIVSNAILYQYAADNLTEEACSDRQDYDNCKITQIAIKEDIQKEMKRINKVQLDILNAQEGDLVLNNTGTNWFENSYAIKDTLFFSHDPSKKVSKKTATANITLLETLNAAEKDINIVSPYLIPTPNLVQVLKSLIAKGVRVRIITNSMGSTDNLFAQAGYREQKSKLIKLGIELYEYAGPDTLHAKTALIDNKTILIGTYNIDPRSAFINREVGVRIEDNMNTGMAKEHDAIIEKLRENAVLVGKDGTEFENPADEKISAKKKLLLKAIHLAHPSYSKSTLRLNNRSR